MDKINKLSLIERINRMMSDEQFREHCYNCKNNNPNFEYEMEIAEKIARLDIEDLTVDESLIHLGASFPEDVVDSQILTFYKELDNICPDGIRLEATAKENMQYISHDATKEKSPRSYCCSAVNKDGTGFRKIFINIEGRIGDFSNACHEVCHSLSESFIAMKPMKDKNMQEVATVIVDVFSAEFFKKEFPNLQINFIENAISTQIQNVLKAREVLLDGLIIKLMVGEITLEEVQKKYGDLYLKNTSILNRCLNNIENKQFSNMFEKKYLLPQAIAQIMLDRFKTDPAVAVKQLKTIIENDTEWDVFDTLKNIGLAGVTEVFDDYINNFEVRTQKLLIEKEELQKTNDANEL